MRAISLTLLSPAFVPLDVGRFTLSGSMSRLLHFSSPFSALRSVFFPFVRVVSRYYVTHSLPVVDSTSGEFWIAILPLCFMHPASEIFISISAMPFVVVLYSLLSLPAGSFPLCIDVLILRIS